MASIGELTATVRADISGYVGPMRQVAATNAQVANGMQDTARTATGVVRPLNQLRGALFDVAAGALGLRGKLSNAAEGLLLFGGGGAAVIAATAGLALLGQAFTKWRETVEREAQQAEQTWTRTLDRMRSRDPFIDLIDEREEATKRLAKAERELAAAQAPQRIESASGNTIGFRPIDPAAVAAARLEVSRAAAALAEVNRALGEQRTEIQQNRLDELADGAREAAKYQRELADSTRGFSAQAFNLYGGDILTSAVTQLQKQLEVQRQLKAAIEATTEAEGQALRAAVDKAGQPDTKDTARETLDRALQGARDAANAMAHAFTSVFADNQESIAQRIGAVLRAAILDAIEKLIAQKIFEGLLGALTGAKSTPLISDLPVIGGFLGAPSAASGISGSATVLVPVSSLPPAMSPVEYARDAQWGTLFAETFRVAEANGAVRFRRV